MPKVEELPTKVEEVGTEDTQGAELTCGIYGPADTGEAHNRPQAPKVGPYKDFNVQVPKDCDENEEDADT